MNFDWNDNKAARNVKDHQVTFEEAATVFDDPFFVALVDDIHSYDEPRYWLIGESDQGNLLLVVYTERDEIVWIISAREVTKRERRIYEQEKYS